MSVLIYKIYISPQRHFLISTQKIEISIDILST